ncbi:MAG: substrate-binding domain-containing protein [Ruminococcus sp.]|nr:substrate-binding domain-containing protein [Ruminococcus sp.]
MKKRKLVGVLITDCHVDFQEEILRGIISQAFKSQCDIAVLAPFHNFYLHSAHRDMEKSIFSLILSDRFDGFLYDKLTFHDDSVQKYVDDLLVRSGKPVMLLDSGGHRSFESTSIDDGEAFEAITDHLINVHGMRDILCLTGPKGTFAAEERLKGYKNSMKKHGLRCDKSHIRYGDFWKDSAHQLARDIINGNVSMPEAVVCGNDVSAEELIAALSKGGIRVPEDIAVTGYDATIHGMSFEPPLTSYIRPNFQMGAEAFRRLYRIMTGRICNKIPDRNGGLCIGKSCGCMGVPRLSAKMRRRNAVTSKFEGYLLYGDMLFDVTNTADLSEFADTVDRYTFFIHKMSHVGLFITRKYIESPGGSFGSRLTFECGDEVKMILSKSSIKRRESGTEYFSSESLIPVFSEERPFPSAYYISPLHYNSNLFGYAAVSFGKEPMSFTSLYLQWINYINIALEQLRIKTFMSRTITETNHALLYDSYTGLLNRSGMEHELAVLLSEAEENVMVDCLRFHLTGISKTYYQSGEEKCDRMITAFAAAVRSCLYDDEVCGRWSNNSIGVITLRQGRAEAIYPELCERIRESGADGDSCNIDFTLGSCVIEEAGGSSGKNGSAMSLSAAMHRAVVDRMFTYTLSEQNENPQFSKLCMLRSRIMKNPEKPWNISEIAENLYLSKSYLQKIYKTYFGKSIIEEMIQFRIDKAKELLANTDMTVTEISKECGYSSYNYFVRQFKSSEGVSPSEYRAGCPEKGSGGEEQ